MSFLSRLFGKKENDMEAQAGFHIPHSYGKSEKIEDMKDELTRLRKIEVEADKLCSSFEKIRRYQDQRLGHGLKEACQCWEESSDTGGMMDFTGLIQALKGK